MGVTQFMLSSFTMNIVEQFTSLQCLFYKYYKSLIAYMWSLNDNTALQTSIATGVATTTIMTSSARILSAANENSRHLPQPVDCIAQNAGKAYTPMYWHIW